MPLSKDETEYLAGLLHDLGKIAIAKNFPDYFNAVYGQESPPGIHYLELEKKLLGMNHAEIGAVYLEAHKLPKPLIDVAKHHHNPEKSTHFPELNAAVSLADSIARTIGLGYSGNPSQFSRTNWKENKTWFQLFEDADDPKYHEAITALESRIESLPNVVNELV